MPYLYVLKCQQFYKIGIASNMESRIASLQTGSPFPIEVISHYEFENPSSVEQVLHQRFSDRKERLEWFSLTSQDLNHIHEICTLLGGIYCNISVSTSDSDEMIAEAIGVDEDTVPLEDKLRLIEANGGRVEVTNNGKYYIIRQGSKENRTSRWGGKFDELPEERKQSYFKRSNARKK